jgi:ABC-type nitrate/sulfonate/bicarbonate transport system permease component
VKSLDAVYLKAALMLGATKWQIFWRVLVPGSLPHVLSGLRIALANGWRALIAGEMVAGDATGLGYAIFQARWNFDYPSAFSCIILIAVIGLTVETLFSFIERHTVDLWGVKLGGQE